MRHLVNYFQVRMVNPRNDILRNTSRQVLTVSKWMVSKLLTLTINILHWSFYKSKGMFHFKIRYLIPIYPYVIDENDHWRSFRLDITISLKLMSLLVLQLNWLEFRGWLQWQVKHQESLLMSSVQREFTGICTSYNFAEITKFS